MSSGALLSADLKLYAASLLMSKILSKSNASGHLHDCQHFSLSDHAASSDPKCEICVYMIDSTLWIHYTSEIHSHSSFPWAHRPQEDAFCAADAICHVRSCMSSLQRTCPWHPWRRIRYACRTARHKHRHRCQHCLLRQTARSMWHHHWQQSHS